MKFKDTILGKLFSHPHEDREDGQDRDERFMEGPVQSFGAAKQAAPLDPLIPDTAYELDLPMDHVLRKLHEMRENEAGGMPSIWLRIEGFEGKELERELARLLKELTAAGRARLAEAVPPKPKAPPKPVKPKNAEDVSEEPEEEEVPPVELDALPFVYVSENKMRAWVMVFPPVGTGKELDREMLALAMEERGVAYGVNEDILDAIPNKKARYFRMFPVAEGLPPVHGKDGEIIDFFDRTEKKELKVDEKGRVDYTSLDRIQSAEEGQTICEVVFPTESVPGRNVLDVEVPGKDGKAAAVPKGQNTHMSEDGTKLLASKHGRVEFSGRVFQVKVVMDVRGNVDYSTGNIDFLGDVHIRGDVCSGFSVKAMGNIKVDGVVEASTLEAGGDLIIAKGIVSDDEAIVRSRRNVYVKYLENGVVHVRGNLVTDCILHSEVYCDGEVQVISGRGAIIGGKILAARSVVANTVGTKSGGHTTIVLGGQPCADFERELLLEGIKEMEKDMRKVERQPDSPDKAKRMSKLRLDLSVSKMRLAQFEKEKEKLKEELEGQGGSRMRCRIAYPGVVLSIGKETLHIAQETSSCNARLVGGEIYLL